MKGTRKIFGGSTGLEKDGFVLDAEAVLAHEGASRSGVSRMLTRSVQLDALSYLVIAALLVLSAVLAFMLFNSITPPQGWLLSGEVVQLLGLLFIGFFVFYQLEQHSRLRVRLHGAVDQAVAAREAAERSAKSLMSAHHAAEIMVAIADEHPLEKVLEGIRRDFDLDAASIIMDDAVSAFRDATSEVHSADVFSRLSIEVVRTGAPAIISEDANGAQALAIPLHVLGKLRGVLCMWQASGGALPDVEGVALLGRVIELGWESRVLFQGAGSHAKSLEAILVKALDQKQPGYALETGRIIELVEKIGKKMAMPADELNDLRLAAKLRDIGLIVSPALGTAVSDHALAGAAVVRAAGLPESVEEAIRCHHMPASRVSVDCTSRGTRILGACASYVEGPVLPVDLTPTTEIPAEPFPPVGLTPSPEVQVSMVDTRGGYA